MDINFSKAQHLITHISGNVHFKSNLSILEVGKVIGKTLFGGLEFDGLDKNYFEEIPGILINNGILGLQISIQENINDNISSNHYVLSITPMHRVDKDYKIVWGRLDCYLSSIFKQTFEDSDIIQVIEDKPM